MASHVDEAALLEFRRENGWPVWPDHVPAVGVLFEDWPSPGTGSLGVVEERVLRSITTSVCVHVASVARAGCRR
jgi:hypothetical protein